MSDYINQFIPQRMSEIRDSKNTSFLVNNYDINRAPVPRVNNEIYYTFFSKNNIQFISDQITIRLRGVHPEGKNIIVPTDKIISVMDSIWYNNYRDYESLTMMTISYIVNYIQSEYQMEQQNKKLSIWVTNFGEETGLRQHSQIKLRERGPNRFVFNMNY